MFVGSINSDASGVLDINLNTTDGSEVLNVFGDGAGITINAWGGTESHIGVDNGGGSQNRKGFADINGATSSRNVIDVEKSW